MNKKAILLTILLLNLTNTATADIYKWTDEQGNVHISDAPVSLPNNAEKILENKKTQQPKPARITGGYFEERIYRTPQPVQQIKPISRQPFEELNKLNRDIDKSITKWQIDANKAAEDAKRTLGLIALAGIIYGIFWTWTIVDILKSDFHKNDKMVWFMAVVFLQALGMIAYLFHGKDQKIKPTEI